MQTLLLIFIAIMATIAVVLQVMRGNKYDIPSYTTTADFVGKQMEENLRSMNHGQYFNTASIGKNEKKRGAIILPQTDLDEARERIIAENTAAGRDTKLSDLYPD